MAASEVKAGGKRIVGRLTFEKTQRFGVRNMVNREQSGRFDESDSFQMNEDLVNRSRMASHRPYDRLATTHHRVDSTPQHFDHLIFPVHRASMAGRTARLLWRSTRLLRVENDVQYAHVSGEHYRSG